MAVLIENGFEVQAPADRLWSYLLDIERMAPCMPGAELTEVVDDRTWKGRVNVSFGPVALSFAGTVTMEERDDAAHRVVLKAQGMEQRGKGAAGANVTSWLEPGDGTTSVKLRADITLSGFVAQVSRGMIPDVSARLTQQFAECLRANMAGEVAPAAAGAVPSPAATPSPRAVGGLRLGLWAFFRAVSRLLRRLFGGSPAG